MFYVIDLMEYNSFMMPYLVLFTGDGEYAKTYTKFTKHVDFFTEQYGSGVVELPPFAIHDEGRARYIVVWVEKQGAAYLGDRMLPGALIAAKPYSKLPKEYSVPEGFVPDGKGEVVPADTKEAPAA